SAWFARGGASFARRGAWFARRGASAADLGAGTRHPSPYRARPGAREAGAAARTARAGRDRGTKRPISIRPRHGHLIAHAIADVPISRGDRRRLAGVVRFADAHVFA